MPPDAPPPSSTTVGLVFDEACQLHIPPEKFGKSTPVEHAERPERTQMIWDQVVKSKLEQQCERVPARDATRDEALTCHSCEHWDALNALEHELPDQRGAWVGPNDDGPLAGAGWLMRGNDMYFNEASPRAARRAAGGVLALTEAVCSGRVRSGFAIVRPPGHHACADRMCGFCFLNSVAMAARAAVRKHGMRRVLIVDWDVHHGNGTQQIFDDDPSVLFVSLHRFCKGFFPGTGAPSEVGRGAGAGHTLNVAWTHEGMSDAEYLAAFDALVLPVCRQFAPELVMVSAGFDAASGDKMGGMELSVQGFAAIAARLALLPSAGGRVVYALEGGYKPSVAARCTLGVLRVLLGAPEVRPLAAAAAAAAEEGAPPSLAGLRRGAQQAIEACARAQAPFWSVLAARAGVQRALRLSGGSSASSPPSSPERGSTRGRAERVSRSSEGVLPEAVTVAVKVAVDAVAAAVGGKSGRENLRLLERDSGTTEWVFSSPPESPGRQLLAETGDAGGLGGGGGASPTSPSLHECCACGASKPRSQYSASQWKKNAGSRRCKACAHERASN